MKQKLWLKNIRILRVTVVLLGNEITMVFWDGAETEKYSFKDMGNQRLGTCSLQAF
jgi:hypothetical protein